MIWLKENSNFVGYVPILKKKYSEEKIREMSKYSCYQGWSSLSRLVMKIQGIGFEYHCVPCDHYKFNAQRLVDIRSDFSFECFLLPSEPKMEHYRSQIFEVFENLTLYKVEEHSEEEIKENIAQAKHSLKHFVSDKTLLTIDYNVSDFFEDTNRTIANLSKLQKMFESKGYMLTYDLFADIDKALAKQIYEERVTKTVLEMNSY